MFGLESVLNKNHLPKETLVFSQNLAKQMQNVVNPPLLIYTGLF